MKNWLFPNFHNINIASNQCSPLKFWYLLSVHVRFHHHSSLKHKNTQYFWYPIRLECFSFQRLRKYAVSFLNDACRRRKTEAFLDWDLPQLWKRRPRTHKLIYSPQLTVLTERFCPEYLVSFSEISYCYVFLYYKVDGWSFNLQKLPWTKHLNG